MKTMLLSIFAASAASFAINLIVFLLFAAKGRKHKPAQVKKFGPVVEAKLSLDF